MSICLSHDGVRLASCLPMERPEESRGDDLTCHDDALKLHWKCFDKRPFSLPLVVESQVSYSRMLCESSLPPPGQSVLPQAAFSGTAFSWGYHNIVRGARFTICLLVALQFHSRRVIAKPSVLELRALIIVHKLGCALYS